jgi:formylglycine-generating enzyme required for sulfatase activity
MGTIGVVAAALIAAFAASVSSEHSKAAGAAVVVNNVVGGSTDTPKPSPLPAPNSLKPVAGAIVTERGDVELVEIPGGTFTMGSPKSEEWRYKGETQHVVKLSPFLIGKYEVTNAQYKLFLAAHPDLMTPRGWDDDLDERQPVVGVSWDDANRFAQWAGARLPTEAEWEYAARGGSVDARYGELDSIAWYVNNSNGLLHPVGRRGPNKLGLYDMLGNAWEWCSDWYGPYQKGAGAALPDPSGPAMGSERVIRGSAWDSYAHHVRAAFRIGYPPEERDSDNGFRLARGR